MYITTIPQVDALINNRGIVSGDAFSPEMRFAYDMFGTGTNQMNMQNYAQAIQIFLSILDDYPDFVAARVNLAVCLRNTGDLQQALSQLQIAHQFAPDDADIHMAMGLIFDAAGNKQEELRQYQLALQDSPNHVRAMSNIGAVYREVRQYRESENWLKKALKQIEQSEQALTNTGWQHPDKWMLLYNLANLYEDMGEWSRAVECREQCVFLVPNNPQFRHLLEETKQKADQFSHR